MSKEFPEAAFQTLVQRLHAPVFFEKLARDYGIVATTAEEQQVYLELAAAANAKKAHEAVKAASATGSLAQEVLTGVRSALVRDGILPPQNAAQDRQIKEAAFIAAQDQELLAAAEAYAAYLASQSG